MMTDDAWDEERDAEMEQRLAALFRAAGAPAPSGGFTSQTMKAVRRASLPHGRLPLHRAWTRPAGWAALVFAAVVAVAAVAAQPPAVARALWLLALGVRLGAQLVQSVHVASSFFDAMDVVSRAVSQAMYTREAAAGLLLSACAAATSLAMLNRLLYPSKESLT